MVSNDDVVCMMMFTSEIPTGDTGTLYKNMLTWRNMQETQLEYTQ